MNYLDLFSGAGGLSEGFIKNGFNPVAHVEMNEFATFTLKTRLAYHYLYEVNKKEIYKDYITGKMDRNTFYSFIPENILNSVINSEITDSSIHSIFDNIKSLMKKNNQKKIDLIIGGPPCQAYSIVGRSRDPENKENDPRKYLYKHYIKFLKKFKPEMFVFENVPGILSAGKGELFNSIVSDLNKAGYITEAKELNASDFGVLQVRKRIIIIGWKKDISLSYPDFAKIKSKFKVNSLLDDMPSLEPGDAIVNGEYYSEVNKYLSSTGIRKKNDPLIQHISRIHNSRDREIYRIAIELWDKERKRLNYAHLPEKLKTHNNQKSFLDRFKVVDYKGYSHTMVAHISRDGHHYIHPDVDQLRSISVREAARIQSFPDDYYFEGYRTSAFRQIGNAVPPLMAERIAEKIKEIII
ncbi:MAG: DNA cytosine methyltransferase [bacterium]|nr:DNA cytosine methyltransferase [bacterium]